MKRFVRVCLALLLVLALLSAGTLQVHAQDGTPPGDGGSSGSPDDRDENNNDEGEEVTSEEGTTVVGVAGVVSTVVQNISHELFFPSDVFAEALTYIFRVAAAREERGIQGMMGPWMGTFYALLRPPGEGYFKALSERSLPIAAGLAVPFFILRLAIYHWNNLIGHKDDLFAAIGDWLTAGVLVIAVGPGLDLVVKIAWWMVGVTTGEPVRLAYNYTSFFTSVSLVQTFLPGASFLRSIVVTAILVTAILAVASIGLAFLSGSVALFLLAYIGPPIMVIGVLPQARWLRSMWLQGVVIVCLLPLAAGVIFTVGLEAAANLPGDNLITILFRVLFLFGASGFLFSLSGILGKLTIGAASDVLKGLVKAGKAVFDSAVLAGVIIATGGAAAPAAAGAAGAGAASASVGSSGATAATSTAGGLSSAAGSLQSAQGFTKAANLASAFGMDKTASFLRGNAAVQQLQSRQAELSARAAMFGESAGGPQPPASTSGFGTRADAAIGRVFNGPNANALFDRGFNGLRDHAGPDGKEWLGNMMKSGTDDMLTDIAKMANAYNEFTSQVESSDRPLWEAANLGGASSDTLNFLDLMD